MEHLRRLLRWVWSFNYILQNYIQDFPADIYVGSYKQKQKPSFA